MRGKSHCIRAANLFYHLFFFNSGSCLFMMGGMGRAGKGGGVAHGCVGLGFLHLFLAVSASVNQQPSRFIYMGLAASISIFPELLCTRDSRGFFFHCSASFFFFSFQVRFSFHLDGRRLSTCTHSYTPPTNQPFFSSFFLQTNSFPFFYNTVLSFYSII